MAIIRIKSTENIKEEEARLNDILSSINNHNQSYTDEQNRKAREAELQQEAKEREERNARMMEQFRLRHEKEEENKKLRKDAEVQARQEAQKRQEKNPLNGLLKKIRAEKKVIDAENDGVEKENFFLCFIANTVERFGDMYITSREWILMKKRLIANALIRFLAKTVGFAIPDLPEDIESEEARISQKKEAKKMKKEEQKRLLAERRAEELAKKKQAAEKKKQEQEEKRLAKEQRKKTVAAPSPVASEKHVVPSEIPSSPTERTTLPIDDVEVVTEEVRSATHPDPSELSDEEWDARLDEDFRDLKEDIVYAHTIPSFRSTEHAIMEIQNMEEILAILVTSKDMNHLFIFSDKDAFIDLITDRLNYAVDYSYIYVITPTAPIYYGSDTCYHKLTVVFNDIRMLILRGRKFFSEKDLKNVEGINMFRNIYIS